MAGTGTGRRTALSAALVIGMIAALLVGVLSPTTAGAAPGHSVELRVLVLSVGDRAADTELDLIAGVMDNIGVPYDVVDVLTTDLTIESFSGARLGASFYNIWQTQSGSTSPTTAFLKLAELRAYGTAVNEEQLEGIISEMRAEYGI